MEDPNTKDAPNRTTNYFREIRKLATDNEKKMDGMGVHVSRSINKLLEAKYVKGKGGELDLEAADPFSSRAHLGVSDAATEVDNSIRALVEMWRNWVAENVTRSAPVVVPAAPVVVPPVNIKVETPPGQGGLGKW